MPSSHIGHVVHIDLTVENADEIREFYAQVCGWETHAVSMGDYDDYMMLGKGTRPVPPPEQAASVAGICHAKGGNATMPSQWLIYIAVANLDASLEACERLGGKIRTKTKSYGDDRYCAIEDPSGAVIGLYQSG
jgi:uncharacterized protein